MFCLFIIIFSLSFYTRKNQNVIQEFSSVLSIKFFVGFSLSKFIIISSIFSTVSLLVKQMDYALYMVSLNLSVPQFPQQQNGGKPLSSQESSEVIVC